MTIQIGNYNFEGPFANTSNLKQQSGVYAILGRSTHPQWSVVDIGESSDVQYRVTNHDRKDCWNRRGYSELRCAALYVPERQRMAIEQTLRAQFNPPCGVC